MDFSFPVSFRIFPLQPYIMQRRGEMPGGRRCRKNISSSEFSGCLVWGWPLHYSYVGWSLITCQAATTLKQLFYWPSSPLTLLFLSSPLSLLLFLSSIFPVFTLTPMLFQSAKACTLQQQQTRDKTRTANKIPKSIKIHKNLPSSKDNKEGWAGWSNSNEIPCCL